MLPDPGPSDPTMPQMTVAIQFKSLRRDDDSYEIGRIGNYTDSGQYLKVKIDDEQLGKITESHKGFPYREEELFYGIPLPATRFRDSQYLPWMIFIDAFDLPKGTTRLYIPPYYCPGAFIKELDISNMEDLSESNGNRANTTSKLMNLGLSGYGGRRSSGRFPVSHWSKLDDIAQSVYGVSNLDTISKTSYDKRKSIVNDPPDNSALPRTYGIYAGSGGDDPELIMPKILEWQEIQQELKDQSPGFGRAITDRITPDGGESNSDAPDDNVLIPPDGWTLFVSTTTEEEAN